VLFNTFHEKNLRKFPSYAPGGISVCADLVNHDSQMLAICTVV